jgi:uncharacterized membrane protein
VVPPTPLPPAATAPAPPRPAITPERLGVFAGIAVGALFILIGTGFGLREVAERGWLVPSARVAMGMSTATAVWVGAWFLRSRAPAVAAALAGTAAGTLYGVLYAAHDLYGFLGGNTTFGLMTAVTAVAFLHADRTRSQALAGVALVGGLMAPILVSSGDNRPVAFFSYLTVLAAGVVAVSVRREWQVLVVAAAAGVTFEYLGWVGSWYGLDQVLYGFGAVTALSLPFAAAGARGHKTAQAIAAGMPLLAIPWVGPRLSNVYDPHTLDILDGTLGTEAMWVPAGIAVVSLPSLLSLRLKPDTAILGVSGLALAVLTAGALPWTGATLVPIVGVSGAALAALLTATASQRGPTAALPYGLVALSGGALLAVTAVESNNEPLGLYAIAGLAALGLVGAQLTSGGRLAAAALACGGALGIAAVNGHDTGAVDGLATSALLVLMLLGHAPLLAPKRDAVSRTVAGAASAVVYLPLHVAWEERFGDDAIGLLALLLGASTLLGAAVLVRRREVTRDSGAFGTFAAFALAGATLALPMQLEQQWLTVGLALEGAAVAWLSTRIRIPVLWWASVALGTAIGVRLLMNPEALAYGDASGMILFNWTLYTWGVPAVALAASAYWLQQTVDEPHRAPGGPLWLLVLATLVGFALVNVEVSHAFRDAGSVTLATTGIVEGMVRSLSWAAYGMALLGFGLAREVRVLRLVGFGFILLGAARVFLIDLWSLSGFARVGSVLGLGGSLLIAAFAFERLVLRSRNDDPEEPR